MMGSGCNGCNVLSFGSALRLYSNCNKISEHPPRDPCQLDADVEIIVEYWIQIIIQYSNNSFHWNPRLIQIIYLGLLFQVKSSIVPDKWKIRDIVKEVCFFALDNQYSKIVMFHGFMQPHMLPPFSSHIANLRKGQNTHIRELSWSLERVHQDHFLLLTSCKWIKRSAPPFIHQGIRLSLFWHFCQVCSSIYTTKENSCNTIHRHRLKGLHNVETCAEMQNKIQLPET